MCPPLFEILSCVLVERCYIYSARVDCILLFSCVDSYNSSKFIGHGDSNEESTTGQSANAWC